MHIFVRHKAFARVHIICCFGALYIVEMVYINDASKERLFEGRSGKKVVLEGFCGADFYGLW
jgi:hypothetical protein